jgi:hypothetical protein
MAMNCEDKANVFYLFFIFQQCLYFPSSFGLVFFSRTCKIVFGSPSFAHILPRWVEQLAHMSLDSGSPILDHPCCKIKEKGQKVYEYRGILEYNGKWPLKPALKRCWTRGLSHPCVSHTVPTVHPLQMLHL